MQMKKEWASANEAHYIYCVNRAWLRDKWNNGRGEIERREIEFTGRDGLVYTKFLYKCADIERALAKDKNGGVR